MELEKSSRGRLMLAMLQIKFYRKQNGKRLYKGLELLNDTIMYKKEGGPEMSVFV